MSTAGAVTQYDNTTYISSISSGLDTNSLVEAAVAQKTAPADRIDVKVEENELKINEYKELQSLSQDLEMSLEKLRSKNYSSLGASNDFDHKQAYFSSSSLANPGDHIAVSVDDKAVAANYNIEVTQLAQKMKVTSAPQSNTALGLTGDFSLGLDGVMGGPISVTPDMTVSDIADQINATSTQTGVHATLIAIDDSTTQLILSADRTAAQISYSSVSGDDIFAALGIVDGLGNFSNVTQAAQPAKMIIDGNEIIRDSNEISDAISGVNFSLLNAAPGSTINMDINHDYNTVKKSITEFIDSYNALREFILNQQAITEDGAVSEDSVLFADTLLRNMDAGIYDSLNANTYGASTNINTLSELGIEMDSSNRLYLADENKLDNLLLTDFAALENFFEASYQGTDSRLKILKNDTLNSNMTFSLALTADNQGKITDVLVDGQAGLFDIQDNLITGKKGTLYEGLSFAITLDPLESTTIDVNLETGFADSLGNYLNVYSNNLDGLVQNEITRLSKNNSTLEEEAAKIRQDAEVYRQREIDKYAKMETELQEAELLRKQINAILGEEKMTEHDTAPAPGGHKAYRKKLHGAASREEILLSLNKGIYGFLKAAKFSYEQNSLDKMCRNTQKSLQIIQALKGHFAMLKAGKNGVILQRYYDWLFKKIVSIQHVNDITSEFDYILSTVESFCQSLEDATSPRNSGQNFPTRANIVA